MAAALGLITGLAALCWSMQTHAHAPTLVGLSLAWLLMVVLSRWALRRQSWPLGQLQWDGQAWWFLAPGLASAPQAVTVRVVWDGGVAMCVRVQADQDGRAQGAAGYAWLRAHHMPTVWHAWRCAVHQRDTL